MSNLEILDEAAAGIYIGGKESPISARTMQRWRLANVGPKFITVGEGRLIRYRQSDLVEYLNNCTSTSGEESDPEMLEKEV
ncbi:hypothetical protein MTBPR1_140008 [Candidatus Terasakiella magnetica]|uniref:Helix-turn-helix domain-containing protein n=1 Tax=Candidatus Terasakiella magnetica TaxID=1867952 RepID=A0A1C3RF31_9PROT|nr:DNA-binding protein [Candidatus Terasakiella magnetica]SCA55890.1 hypothetical protein MTBPR1_140008 [Candidatus Terasakiella magnetica]